MNPFIYRSLLLFFIFLFFVNPTFAQNSGQISGSTIDANTKELVDFASIALLQGENNTYVAGAQSNAKGAFVFSNLADGVYLLRITFVGYQEFLRPAIKIENGRHVNLGVLALVPEDTQVLSEVLIEGQTPSMQLGIDRKVFNVAQSMISEGGTVSDLLSDIPSLSVDMDGEVSLRGTSGVQILIDGKPSAMAGSDITQVLQSMPANSIQSIEVITNPSSKYEAEGQSGIINIILKKNLRTGLNGMVNVSGGSDHNYNGGLNFNYRDTKFNYSGSYAYRRGNRLGDGFNLNHNLINNSITENHSESVRKGDSHTGRLGVDYFINEKNTLGLSGNFNIRDNNSNETIFYQYRNQPLEGESTRWSERNQDNSAFDLSLDYKREFKRKGEELVLNLSFGQNERDGIQNLRQEFIDFNENNDLSVNDTYDKGNTSNIQLDYILPFGEDTHFEAGYRSSIQRNRSKQLTDSFDFSIDRFVPDYDLSNEFELDDQVHALYANYQSRFSPNLGFQVGLRAEQAYLNTKYIALDPSLPVAERTIPSKLGYLRIYPSLFLTQKLNEDQQLQVSYTRRVRRPRGWQVNPFKDVSDPMNIRMGNANLLPEDIHSFELSYAKYWRTITFTSSVYHRRVNDVIESVRSSADDQTAATLSQWLNLNKSEATGFETISKVNFTKSIDATANFNLFYNKFHGSAEYNIAPKDGYNWDANLSSNVKISNPLSAQVRANYFAPRIQAQGRTNSSFVMDAGLKMDVLNSRGSFLLNVRDLFNQRMWSGYTETEQFTQNFNRRWMRRSFMLSFNYRFGTQDITERRNRKRNMNEEEGGFEEPQM